MRHANITRWVILVMALSCVCGYSFGQTPNKLSSPTAANKGVMTRDVTGAWQGEENNGFRDLFGLPATALERNG